MPAFRATNQTTAEVVEYTEAVPQQEHFGSEWLLEEVIVSEGSADAVPLVLPVYGGRRVLTRLEFLCLMTAQERIAIKQFALGTTPYALAVADYMMLLELAEEVNLDNVDMQQGVPMLEQLTLLAPGRAEEILNG